MEDGAGAQSNPRDCDQFVANFNDPPKKKTKNNSKPTVTKGTDEYLKKRARNNEAVRKSRVKSRKKIEETQHRVDLLMKENSDLKTKVTLLTKELTVLRSLFANGGVTPPENVENTEEVKTESSEKDE